MELSAVAQKMQGSVIRKMFNEALTIRDPINFTVGEPDFVTPRPIIDIACEAWQRGLTHYTPNAGIYPLRKAIADYHRDRGEFDVDPNSQILVTCGATEALQLALFTVVNPGDEVILIEPMWPNYVGQITMAGAVVKTVPTSEANGFRPKAEDVERAITPKTKAVILNSPCNPTGAVIHREDYSAIIDLLLGYHIWIIADEVYSRLIYTDEPFTGISSFPAALERSIYINSFSKMFAMTGWRLGYAIAPPKVIGYMTKLHENGASCLAEPGQLAAAGALRDCGGEIERMREAFRDRRDLMCSLINGIDGLSCKVPEGAFYVFVNIGQTGMRSEEFCMDLLHQTGVVAVPGNGFGVAGEGFIRVTYAASQASIKEGMARLKGYVEGR